MHIYNTTHKQQTHALNKQKPAQTHTHNFNDTLFVATHQPNSRHNKWVTVAFSEFFKHNPKPIFVWGFGFYEVGVWAVERDETQTLPF